MRLVIALALGCLALPAQADVKDVLQRHIHPGIDQLATQTRALAETAQDDCTAKSLRPAYHAAFDAWMGVSHLAFGPLEKDGRMLAIAFWPDTRGIVPRAVSRLVADADPEIKSPDAFAEVSVAARGVFALERLLYDAEFSGYDQQDYSCALVRAITADLARVAQAVDADWESFATTMQSAGQPGNKRFLSDREPQLALYTALLTGLEFTEEQRLGRPLGSFERPRPNRAEARRSARSLRNVELSLKALRDLARALAEAPISRTEAAFARALDAAARVETPDFSGVQDPAERLHIEIVQQRVGDVRNAVSGEIGEALGLSSGFNSLDGD